jgi:hypothetical protein
MRILVACALAIVLGLALCGFLFSASFLMGREVVGAAGMPVDLMVRLGADRAFIGAMVGRRHGAIALAGGVVGALCADLSLMLATLVHGFWQSLGTPALVQPHLSDSSWSAVATLLVVTITALGGVLGARHGIVRQERKL